jgi:hypothetical protein
VPSGNVEINQPVHRLGEQDEPGPGEWLAVAQRIATLGKGTTAIVEKIIALTASADPPHELPPPRREESEALVLPFTRHSRSAHKEAA